MVVSQRAKQATPSRNTISITKTTQPAHNFLKAPRGHAKPSPSSLFQTSKPSPARASLSPSPIFLPHAGVLNPTTNAQNQRASDRDPAQARSKEREKEERRGESGGGGADDGGARSRDNRAPAADKPQTTTTNMGLLTIIRKVKRKEREMRLLMVGLDNAGKTTAVRRLKASGAADAAAAQLLLDGISPTLGFSICSLSRRGRKLNVWDVGGQRSLRPYWRNYFERTDGVVWVVDSSDLARLRDAAAELRALLGEERLAGATLLVLANKQDVEGALGLEEISRALGLAAAEEAGAGGGDDDAAAADAGGEKTAEAAAPPLAGALGKRRHWRVAACSARTGQGLEEAFDWIVDDVGSRIYMFDD